MDEASLINVKNLPIRVNECISSQLCKVDESREEGEGGSILRLVSKFACSGGGDGGGKDK